MIRRLGFASVLLLAGILSFGRSAQADTIASVTNPNDGFGSSYTLSDTCNVSNVCTVTLQINTTNATLSNIDAVAFKIGTLDTFLSTGTLTAPGPSTWTTGNGSLNSGGSGPCGTNSNGQSCTFASSPSSGAATGGTLTWTWTGIQVDTNSIAHVGYQYNNGGSGPFKGNIVSCDYTNGSSSNCNNGPGVPPHTVSEPVSFSVMAIGLAVVGLTRRRKLA